jgi:hypothetical protein
MVADHASPMQELMAGLMSSGPPPGSPPGSRPPPAPMGAMGPVTGPMTGPPAPLPSSPNPPPPEVDLALANTVAMTSPLVPTSPTAPPAWMETSTVSPHSTRTGASPMKGSGLGTLAFFALIGVAVAVAGIAGVVLWGPEKTIANRSHLASDPPPPQVLPGLPASADAPPAPAESASTTASAAPEPSAPKKGKKWQKGRKTH